VAELVVCLNGWHRQCLGVNRGNSHSSGRAAGRQLPCVWMHVLLKADKGTWYRVQELRIARAWVDGGGMSGMWFGAGWSQKGEQVRPLECL
jgi:hypothetical protein